MSDELTPCNNPELFGHEAVEELLRSDLANGKLPHGIILSGPRGIGKATLAYRFARELLSQGVRDKEAVARRIAAGSHVDLLVIEQLFDPKKEELANDISVEQARTIAESLAFTPGEGQWRIVIIDSADALNNNAANAILKILEEPPPQTLLMLISHNPGRLLPTIRSRCRTIHLKPLSREDFNRVIRHTAPEIYGDELALLGMLASHSPGVALEMRAQGAGDMYTQILELLTPLPQLDTLALHRFCDAIGTGKTHSNWRLLGQVMLCLLERVTKAASGVAIQAVNEEEGAALAKLAGLHPAHIWAQKWQQAADQFSLAQKLHLDYKQVALAFFHSLASRDEFVIGTAA